MIMMFIHFPEILFSGNFFYSEQLR
jgi:hypothetical protein